MADLAHAIELVPIFADGSVPGFRGEIGETGIEWLAATAAYYDKIGFTPPWISYLAVRRGTAVGTCAFKGPPNGNTVEIAYGTLPGLEGQGVATAMAGALVRAAYDARPEVRVTARTLPQKSASTAVLRKNGFSLTGLVDDPEDGSVWEWVHPRD